MQIIDLPPLPTNARYVLHNNECYDWGTFGWALTTQGINVDKYSYFVFMNSSVRGPFVPSYIKVRITLNMRWPYPISAASADLVAVEC